MYPDQSPTELEQNLSLRDYLDILNKRRGMVVTVFLIVFTIALILGLSKEEPLYTSTSTILMERNLGPGSAGLGTYYYWDPEFLPTQTEIIRSRKVALRVVKDLQLDTRYRTHFLGTKPADPSLITSVRKSVTIFFKSLLEDGNSPEPGAAPVADREKLEQGRIADIIKSGIDVQPVKETRVVNILYTDSDPRLARMITDAIVQAYIEETQEIKLSGTQQSLRWMSAKAEQERKKLEESERNLQKYMREHNLVTLENRLAIYPEKLSQFSTELSSAEARRKELEDLRDQIARFSDSPQVLETLPVFRKSATLQSLRDQILKAEQRVQELSQKYGPRHPAMIKAVEDRDILLREKNLEIKRITESVHKSYELARSNENNLRELLNSTKEELLDVNERFIQYSIMKREVESSRALYEALTSSLKKASVTEESQNVNIWVMREASLPREPSNQRPRRTILIGFILALAAGIGFALLVEYLDDTIKTPDDLENRYGLTVLGTVLQARKNERIENIFVDNPQSPIAESYRLIRSSLLLSSADHPPQIILILSMKAQEGKTSTALNLARTMAQVAQRVLLIDADMRKPRLHSLLRVPNETGLSSFLSGNIDEYVTHATREEKIYLLPAGPIPPNPVELISSQRLKILLKQLEKDFDYIIIDSPPIINLADGLVLSTMADGTVLITRAGKTTFDTFKLGLKNLNEFRPRILGVILNGLSSRLSGPFSYAHYYRYYQEDSDGTGAR